MPSETVGTLDAGTTHRGTADSHGPRDMNRKIQFSCVLAGLLLESVGGRTAANVAAPHRGVSAEVIRTSTLGPSVSQSLQFITTELHRTAARGYRVVRRYHCFVYLLFSFFLFTLTINNK